MITFSDFHHLWIVHFDHFSVLPFVINWQFCGKWHFSHVSACNVIRPYGNYSKCHKEEYDIMCGGSPLILFFVFWSVKSWFHVGEITQGRILIDSRSPLYEPVWSQHALLVTNSDVGEIHRVAYYINYSVLPSLNRILVLIFLFVWSLLKCRGDSKGEEILKLSFSLLWTENRRFLKGVIFAHFMCAQFCMHFRTMPDDTQC